MKVGSVATLAQSLGFLRPFWPLAVFAGVASTVSGVASGALLATINRAVHAQGSVLVGVLAAFAGLCVVSIASEFAGSFGNSLVGQRILATLRKELSARILSAPIAEIERFQSHRLIVILAQDVATIGAFALNFSVIAISFAVAAGGLAYLAMLSSVMFLVAMAAVTLMFAAQAIASQRAAKGFNAVREAHDELQRDYRAVIEGAKEIRIDRRRRMKIVDQLIGTIRRIADQLVDVARIFFAARALNSLLFYGTLLAVLALGGRMEADTRAMSGFVFVLLYVRGPIEQLVAALPLFGQAQVSLRKVAELSAAIARDEPAPALAGSTAPRFVGATIELRDVCYEFPGRDGTTGFALGPISLTVEAGETLFIVGKNGSGKTTLLKILLGLYTPQQGQVLCDGELVQPAQLDDYRQLFSVVFVDYFLFDELVEADQTTLQEAARYLHLLELADKVSIGGGRFSTTDLSSGQRKRLALIHALLARRPIVVLDDWAAEQDPTFRRVFYEELLPEMRRQGRTLILVSHDDRYFHVADRVIRMQAGRLEADRLAEVPPGSISGEGAAAPGAPTDT
jgi:putative ATP-binding cassette transporter